MHATTRLLKTTYRAAHTERVVPEDPELPTVRKRRTGAPSLKEFAADDPDGRRWLERKRG